MLKRDSSIVFIRGIAVTSVILHHYFQNIQIYKLSIPLQYFCNFFLDYGAYGVQLFFAVSGFILIQKYSYIDSVKTFILLRYTRLVPMLSIAIFFNLLLQFFGKKETINFQNIIPSLFMLEPQLFNVIFHSENFKWIDQSFWSLFVEIRFYLIYGILIRIFNSKTIHTKKLMLLGFFIAVEFFYGLSLFLDLELMRKILFWFFIPDYLVYFIFGIYLGSKCAASRRNEYIFISAICLYMFFITNFESKFENFAFADFFTSNILLFIIVPIFSSAKIISDKFTFPRKFSEIVGKSSYTSYLLHNNTFLFSIYFLPVKFHLFSICLVFYASVILVSFILTNYLDNKMITKLRSAIHL